MSTDDPIDIHPVPVDLKLWVEVKEPTKTAAGDTNTSNSGTTTSNSGATAPAAPGDLIPSSPDLVFNIAVGLRMMHIACSNFPITNVAWNIQHQDWTIANYVFTPATGAPILLTPADLNTNPIVFCWWRGGRFSVTCTITTTAGSGNVRHDFVVATPQVDFFRRTYAGVVAVGIDNQHRRMLQFVRSVEMFNEPGIVMRAQVSGLANISGLLAGIQLACNQRFCTTPDFRNYHLSTNGQYILDIGQTGTTFYQTTVERLPAGGTGYYVATDSPGSELNSAVRTSMMIGAGDAPPYVPEQYRMHLMFRPESPGATYVPIKVLTWGWAGASEFEDGQWKPAQDTVVPDAVATDPVVIPSWNLNTSNSQWVP
jgi:hypothetical protein